MKKRAAAALVLALTAAPGGIVRAGTIMLGEFRPVAAEESARAVWSNPAAIAASGTASMILEAVWLDTFSSGLEPGEITYLDVAASTDVAAYGFQKNFGGVDGVADWTLTASRAAPIDARTLVGIGLEWKHDDGSTLDGTVGLLMLLGQELRAAAVVENVVESREGDRRIWRGGLAWRRQRLGYLSWDLRAIDAETTVHWFGVGFDRFRILRLAFHMNLESDWSAFVGVGLTQHVLGAGLREVDERRDARFAGWEWRGGVQASPR